MQKSLTIIIVLSACCLMSSCVSQKKFEDQLARADTYQSQSMSAQDQVRALQSTRDSLQNSIAEINKQLEDLQSDTSALTSKFRQTQDLNHHLNDLYDQAVTQNKASASTQSRLSNELLNLQQLLARKDSAVNALKTRIQSALMGFDKSDLTVTNRNGRIYVSLAEKLLFKTGSTAVDPKGVEALKKLAEVLQKDSTINIMIEGHTDNVPLKGSGYLKDNWDLSVLRATSIVRILTGFEVQPNRITASGRSEFDPVASNDDSPGRSLNRRTDIILTPNLDELYRILGTD
jgi:chemotaxis protein MotB